MIWIYVAVVLCLVVLCAVVCAVKHRKRLTQAHTRSNDRTDKIDTMTRAYYLIFRHQDDADCRFKEMVNGAEFRRRKMGDGCDVLVLLHDRKNTYEIDGIFRGNETLVLAELEKRFFAKEGVTRTHPRGV